jgi:hypothetical protein
VATTEQGATQGFRLTRALRWSRAQRWSPSACCVAAYHDRVKATDNQQGLQESPQRGGSEAAECQGGQDEPVRGRGSIDDADRDLDEQSDYSGFSAHVSAPQEVSSVP